MLDVMLTTTLATALGLAQPQEAAGPPSAQDVIESVQGLEAQELEAWARTIAADEQRDVSEVVSEVLVGVTFWLGPHAERAAQAETGPYEGLEKAVADASRALAAVGPRAAVRLAELAITEPSDIFVASLAVGALEVLGSDAAAAIPVLEAGLSAGDTMSRSSAAIGLAFVDGPEYPTLRRALGSDAADVREAAVKGLGRTRSAAALQPLLAALEDPDLAWAACEALAELGPLALPALPKLLASDDVEAEHLAKIGEAAIPLLVEAAHGRDELRRYLAAHALAKIGDPALSSLLALTTDPDPAARMAVATAAVEEPLEPLTPGMIRLLQDDDPRIRSRAIAALAAIDSPTALQAVLAAARDSHPRVAYEALVALGRFESDSETARSALMVALSSGEVHHRSAAMLGLISHLRPEHLDELDAILQRIRDTDPDPELRASAGGYSAAIEAERLPYDPDAPIPSPPPEPPMPLPFE